VVAAYSAGSGTASSSGGFGSLASAGYTQLLNPDGVVVPVVAMLAMEDQQKQQQQQQQQPPLGVSPEGALETGAGRSGFGGSVSERNDGNAAASSSFSSSSSLPSTGRLFSPADVHAVLALQQQQLHTKLQTVASYLPTSGVLTETEARMIVTAQCVSAHAHLRVCLLACVHVCLLACKPLCGHGHTSLTGYFLEGAIHACGWHVCGRASLLREDEEARFSPPASSQHTHACVGTCCCASVPLC
jgi:hypothetical protein